jgi:hypothetical protein
MRSTTLEKDLVSSTNVTNYRLNLYARESTFPTQFSRQKTFGAWCIDELTGSSALGPILRLSTSCSRRSWMSHDPRDELARMTSSRVDRALDRQGFVCPACRSANQQMCDHGGVFDAFSRNLPRMRGSINLT